MEQKKQFIINFAYYVCWMAIIYFGMKYCLPVFLPLILGYLLAVLSHRITRNQPTLILVLIYLVLAALIVWGAVRGVNGLQKLAGQLPSFYRNSIEPAINELYARLVEMAESVSLEDVRTTLESMLSAIRDGVSALGTRLVNSITSGLTSLPHTLWSITIFIVSSFYIAADYERVTAFINKYAGNVKEFAANKLGVVLLSYLKIMGITCCELIIGLSLFGISNSIVLSILISLVDILPVFGVGTVLIPWTIINLILGNYTLALELLLLYIVITAVRQYIEPKFVSKQLNIPPIVTLASMVVGSRLFGLGGMLIMPLLVAYIMYRKGMLNETETPQPPKPDQQGS